MSQNDLAIKLQILGMEEATRGKVSKIEARRVWLIGNRFWPFGALARSLKLEALISMPGCCQMGL